MRASHKAADEFTLKNLTAESANSQVIGGRDAGKKKISHVFCDNPYRRSASLAASAVGLPARGLISAAWQIVRRIRLAA
jgi:hypothetical protein